MSTTALCTAHIPVDEFTILDGPSAKTLRSLHYYPYDSSKERPGRELDVTFTLKTAASESSFTRKIHLRFADTRKNDVFKMLGVFCDELVNIEYDARQRTGQIS